MGVASVSVVAVMSVSTVATSVVAGSDVGVTVTVIVGVAVGGTVPLKLLVTVGMFPPGVSVGVTVDVTVTVPGVRKVGTPSASVTVPLGVAVIGCPPNSDVATGVPLTSKTMPSGVSP